MRIFLLMLLGSLLTACSVFSPVQTEHINEYLIDSVPQVYNIHGTTMKTLAVSLPTANHVYYDKQMAYSLHSHSINYFAKNRWAESPAQMMQPLIVQTLQNTHHFKAVAPPSGVGRYDLLLNTQIHKFQQEFYGPCSIFKLTVRAQLVAFSTGRIIASKEFSVIEPAPYRNPYGGVIAANRATAKMLRELADWCARY